MRILTATVTGFINQCLTGTEKEIFAFLQAIKAQQLAALPDEEKKVYRFRMTTPPGDFDKNEDRHKNDKGIHCYGPDYRYATKCKVCDTLAFRQRNTGLDLKITISPAAAQPALFP